MVPANAGREAGMCRAVTLKSNINSPYLVKRRSHRDLNAAAMFIVHSLIHAAQKGLSPWIDRTGMVHGDSRQVARSGSPPQYVARVAIQLKRIEKRISPRRERASVAYVRTCAW